MAKKSRLFLPQLASELAKVLELPEDESETAVVTIHRAIVGLRRCKKQGVIPPAFAGFDDKAGGGGPVSTMLDFDEMAAELSKAVGFTPRDLTLNSRSRLRDVIVHIKATLDHFRPHRLAERPSLFQALHAMASPTSAAPMAEAPIPMLLYCPECGGRHIDEGEYAQKPHHTHACQHCGLAWRPCVLTTVGVVFLPGFKNEESGQ